MSNYVQTTFFTPKDTLPTTNPAKTIFGAAYDTEFGNIATAILSKYDNTTAAPSLLSLTVGTPTGGNLGAGSINAQSISVNNIAVALAGSVVTSFTSNTGLSINAAATGAVTVTNTGVLSITGTASQITASAATGAVTLSLPSAVTITGLFSASSISLSAGGSVATPQVLIEVSYGFGVDAIGSVFFKNANNGNYYFTNSAGAPTFNVNQGNVSIPAPSSGVALLITGVAGSSALQILGTGVQVGSPTGGDQGAGTLNAIGLYINAGQLFFGVPASASTTAAVTDVGKCINAAAGITVPNAVFSQGHAFSIYNNTAGAITITAGITTMRLAGTAITGNRTLAQRGLATIWFESGTECAVGGPGVS